MGNAAPEGCGNFTAADKLNGSISGPADEKGKFPSANLDTFPETTKPHQALLLHLWKEDGRVAAQDFEHRLRGGLSLTVGVSGGTRQPAIIAGIHDVDQRGLQFSVQHLNCLLLDDLHLAKVDEAMDVVDPQPVVDDGFVEARVTIGDRVSALDSVSVLRLHPRHFGAEGSSPGVKYCCLQRIVHGKILLLDDSTGEPRHARITCCN